MKLSIGLRSSKYSEASDMIFKDSSVKDGLYLYIFIESKSRFKISAECVTNLIYLSHLKFRKQPVVGINFVVLLRLSSVSKRPVF